MTFRVYGQLHDLFSINPDAATLDTMAERWAPVNTWPDGSGGHAAHRLGDTDAVHQILGDVWARLTGSTILHAFFLKLGYDRLLWMVDP